MLYRNLIIVLILLIIVGGCSNSKRIKPHKIDNKVTKKRVAPAAYSYPRRVVSRSSVKVYDPYAKKGVYKPKVSRSLKELDRYSKKSKPTLIYSRRAHRVNYRVRNIDLSPIRGKMLSYINRIRAKGQVRYPLRWDNLLENAASAHAGDMATNNYVGHLGSGRATDLAKKRYGKGSNFYERIARFGYPVKGGNLAGEIVTYTKDSVVGNSDVYFHFIHAIDNFQRSSRHNAVLMSNKFKDIGISAYRGYKRVYWVIEFAEPSY